MVVRAYTVGVSVAPAGISVGVGVFEGVKVAEGVNVEVGVLVQRVAVAVWFACFCAATVAVCCVRKATRLALRSGVGVRVIVGVKVTVGVRVHWVAVCVSLNTAVAVSATSVCAASCSILSNVSAVGGAEVGVAMSTLRLASIPTLRVGGTGVGGNVDLSVAVTVSVGRGDLLGSVVADAGIDVAGSSATAVVATGRLVLVVNKPMVGVALGGLAAAKINALIPKTTSPTNTAPINGSTGRGRAGGTGAGVFASKMARQSV